MPLSARQFDVESQMLVRYRAAETSALQMLAAARDSDWDGVARYEARFRELAQRPSPGPDVGGTSPAARRERLRAIRRLILIDAEVRRACDSRAAMLDAMLSV